MTTKLKVLFICLFLGALPLAACSAAPTAEPTPMPQPPSPTPPPDPLAIVEDYLEALNGGDAEGAAAFLTDNAIFALNLRFQRHNQPEPYVGKATILDFWQSSDWPNITVEATELQAEGSRVVFKCRIFSGELMVSYGSPASNSACVTIVKDGLISFVGDQATELLYSGEE